MKTIGYIENLKLKYDDYHRQGHLVLMVTLSTFQKSEGFAKSYGMERFWNQDFMGRVLRRTPEKYRGKVDHDPIIEGTQRMPDSASAGPVNHFPERVFHFHGLLAFTPEAGKRMWVDGALNKHLARDLDSFKRAGDYRAFPVKAYQIETVREGKMPSNWIRYITKTPDFISWTKDEPSAARCAAWRDR